MVPGQEIRISLLQFQDLLLDGAQVTRGIAVLVMQLFNIGGHDRTFAIKHESTGVRIKGQGIQRAGEGFGFAHGATRRPQMLAG